MANYPQELAQDAVSQSHTGHMTGLWFLPARPLRLNANQRCDILLWKPLTARLLHLALENSTTLVADIHCKQQNAKQVSAFSLHAGTCRPDHVPN